MTWYKMLATHGEYKEGEEYPSLPDELMTDYPGDFTVREENVKIDTNPFD